MSDEIHNATDEVVINDPITWNDEMTERIP